MEQLWQALKHYAQQQHYPFYMPGHKGGRLGAFSELFAQDITEISGFDNLHQPDGMILQSQQRCAALFGAEESFYLVNGSTSGILAAILAVCGNGDEIAVARNCHKSVYSALVLSGAKPTYFMPETLANYDFLGSVLLEQVQNAVTENTKAVILTSPTYEGITSDIATISDFLHKKGIILIVDEAHGSHMKFHDFFPKTALEQGADIVIQSLHKTLPCPTQTAVLHVQSDRVDRKRLKQSLSMVQTSSPSYLFLAAIDYCCDWLQKEGKKAFEDYVKKLNWFYAQAKQWKNITLLQKAGFDRDFSKLVLQLGQIEMTGVQLNDILIQRYSIELEMGSLHYAIAMTSPADTEKGLRMLSDAITEIDAQIDSNAIVQNTDYVKNTLPIVKYSPRQAYWAQKKEKLLFKSTGEICGEFVIPYPPGIPILAPGELITKQKIQQITVLKKANVLFVGCHDSTLHTIDVIQ